MFHFILGPLVPLHPRAAFSSSGKHLGCGLHGNHTDMSTTEMISYIPGADEQWLSADRRTARDGPRRGERHDCLVPELLLCKIDPNFQFAGDGDESGNAR